MYSTPDGPSLMPNMRLYFLLRGGSPGFGVPVAGTLREFPFRCTWMVARRAPRVPGRG